MNHKELYNLLKTVRKNIRCPQCGKQFDFSQIKIRAIAEFVVFLELLCPDHMPVLATVALQNGKLFDDNKNFGLIDNNDILDAHNTLNSLSGSLESLFTPPKNNLKDKKTR